MTERVLGLIKKTIWKSVAEDVRDAISVGSQFISVKACYSLAMAATKGPLGRSAAPLPTGVGRRMERKRQKLVGRDKGNLTEQQMK